MALSFEAKSKSNMRTYRPFVSRRKTPNGVRPCSTVEVITLLTAALRQIKLSPAEGEGLVIVIAGIAMTFEFTPNGLVVSKFTD